MRDNVRIGIEDEPDWFVKPGEEKKIRQRTFAIIRTERIMLYKVMMCTHFASEHWNNWKANEHDMFPAIGQPATGIRINFELNVSITRANEIVDALHNFVEAYLQEAEEFKNGIHIQKEETP